VDRLIGSYGLEKSSSREVPGHQKKGRDLQESTNSSKGKVLFHQWGSYMPLKVIIGCLRERARGGRRGLEQ